MGSTGRGHPTVPLMVLPAFIYGLGVWALGLWHSTEEEHIFFCEIPTTLRGCALDFGFVSNLLLCIFVVATYAVAFVRARNSGASS